MTVVFALLAYGVCFVADGLYPRQGHADLAIVLGSQVLADGKPSARLAARLQEGVWAYRNGLAPLILVSGGAEKSGFDEADVMRAYLIQHGVPEQVILEDRHGITTRASADNATAIMRQRRLQSALIISQYFHIPRCILAFRQAGITHIHAAYPRFVEWRDFYSIAREMAANVYYRFT